MDVLHTIAEHAWQIAGTAASGLLYAGGRYLKTRVVGFAGEIRSGIAQVSTVGEQVSQMQERVAIVEKQLKPNGGSSLADTVKTIDIRTRRMDARSWVMAHVYSTAIFEADELGEFVAVNRAYETLTGFACEDLRGRGWINTVHPDDRHRVVTEWRHAVTDRRAFRMEYRCVTRSRVGAGIDGHPSQDIHRVSVEAEIIHDESTDATIGWLGTMARRGPVAEQEMRTSA